MKIIAFTGKAGAGKDTAAGILIDQLQQRGLNARRFAFADQLKESAAYALGFPAPGSPDRTSAHDPLDWINRVKMDGALTITIPLTDDERELGFPESVSISGREYLQYFGTEAHREVFGSNFWTDAAHRVLEEYDRDGVDVVVITDLRFDNEAEFVWGFAEANIIEVVRPYQNQPHGEHASEAGVKGSYIYYQIANDGSFADLQRKVEAFLSVNPVR